MTDGHQVQQRPLPAAVESRERPVLPTGALRRTSQLALLPLRHAARTAAAASRLSQAASDQIAARTAEQLFATLGELKGGAAKLGQAMSVFEAAMPEEAAAPYRSALRRLTDAAPAMPAEVARRVVAADLAAAYGPGWQERLVAFNDIPAAAASIGQVHRGQWRIDGGQVVQVAVKVQYPGVGQALRSDFRQARLLARAAARLTRLNVSGSSNSGLRRPLYFVYRATRSAICGAYFGPNSRCAHILEYSGMRSFGHSSGYQARLSKNSMGNSIGFKSPTFTIHMRFAP